MVTNDLIELTERLGEQKVLLLGDLMLDRYVYGDAERISPEAPVPVLRAIEEEERVGGSGSVAANLLALGLTVYSCGVVGDDAAGQKLVDLLESDGVNCTGVIRCQNRPTTTKTRLVGLAQHRHRQQLLRFDQESTEPVPSKQIDYLLKVALKLIDRVDIVCIEDYDKGLIREEFVRRITDASRRAGKRVLVDPAALADFSRYRGATLLTPNRNELAVALNARFGDLENMGKAAAELAGQLQLEAVVVTVDREGAVLSLADGTVEHIPTKPRAVYDNTGAGDAVLAMLAAALAAGASLQQAVQMANMAGGLEVEKFGCVPVAKQEVLAELRLEHHRLAGKLRSTDDLLSELTLRRDRGETVGFTNGCFDLLHRGHVEYLQEAAQHADVLVVGLNSDDSIKRLEKGDRRPINRQEDRAAVLSALEAVDYVVLFDDGTPDRLIRAIKPNVLVKGEEWRDRVVGQEFVQSYGGKVVLANLREGFSTTSLIERIRSS